jgi:hypothetical protein
MKNTLKKISGVFAALALGVVLPIAANGGALANAATNVGTYSYTYNGHTVTVSDKTITIPVDVDVTPSIDGDIVPGQAEFDSIYKIPLQEFIKSNTKIDDQGFGAGISAVNVSVTIANEPNKVTSASVKVTLSASLSEGSHTIALRANTPLVANGYESTQVFDLTGTFYVNQDGNPESEGFDVTNATPATPDAPDAGFIAPSEDAALAAVAAKNIALAAGSQDAANVRVNLTGDKFYEGQIVYVGAFSTYTSLGAFTVAADAAGLYISGVNLTALAAGNHTLVLSDIDGNVLGALAVTITVDANGNILATGLGSLDAVSVVAPVVVLVAAGFVGVVAYRRFSATSNA